MSNFKTTTLSAKLLRTMESWPLWEKRSKRPDNYNGRNIAWMVESNYILLINCHCKANNKLQVTNNKTEKRIFESLSVANTCILNVAFAFLQINVIYYFKINGYYYGRSLEDAKWSFVLPENSLFLKKLLNFFYKNYVLPSP